MIDFFLASVAQRETESWVLHGCSRQRQARKVDQADILQYTVTLSRKPSASVSDRKADNFHVLSIDGILLCSLQQ